MSLRPLITLLVIYVLSAPLHAQYSSFYGDKSTDNQIISTQLLPTSAQSLLDLEESFRYENEDNITAIYWIRQIAKANSSEDRAAIFRRIPDELFLLPEHGAALNSLFADVENQISNKSGKDHIQQIKAARLTAYYIHAAYLHQARTDKLNVNPIFAKRYKELVSQKLNKADEFPETSLEDTNSGYNDTSINVEEIQTQAQNWLSDFTRHLPFGYIGLGTILLTILGMLYRLLQREKIPPVISTSPEPPLEDSTPKEGPNNSPPQIIEDVKLVVDTLTNLELIENELEHPELLIAETIFAGRLQNNVFRKSTTSYNLSAGLFFKLEIFTNDHSKAFFTFVEKEEALQEIIDNFPRIFEEACELPKELTSSTIVDPSNIRVASPGIAHKQNDVWEIVQKIKLM